MEGSPDRGLRSPDRGLRSPDRFWRSPDRGLKSPEHGSTLQRRTSSLGLKSREKIGSLKKKFKKFMSNHHDQDKPEVASSSTSVDSTPDRDEEKNSSPAGKQEKYSKSSSSSDSGSSSESEDGSVSSSDSASEKKRKKGPLKKGKKEKKKKNSGSDSSSQEKRQKIGLGSGSDSSSEKKEIIGPPSEQKSAGKTSKKKEKDEPKSSKRKKLLFLLKGEKEESASKLPAVDETPPSSPESRYSRPSSAQSEILGRRLETPSPFLTQRSTPADLAHNVNLYYRAGESSPVHLVHSLSGKESGKNVSQLSEISQAVSPPDSASRSFDRELPSAERILDDDAEPTSPSQPQPEFQMESQAESQVLQSQGRAQNQDQDQDPAESPPARLVKLGSANFYDLQGVWRCRICGWTYTTPYPSPRVRREHKQQCGAFLSRENSLGVEKPGKEAQPAAAAEAALKQPVEEVKQLEAVEKEKEVEEVKEVKEVEEVKAVEAVEEEKEREVGEVKEVEEVKPVEAVEEEKEEEVGEVKEVQEVEQEEEPEKEKEVGEFKEVEEVNAVEEVEQKKKPEKEKEVGELKDVEEVKAVEEEPEKEQKVEEVEEVKELEEEKGLEEVEVQELTEVEEIKEVEALEKEVDREEVEVLEHSGEEDIEEEVEQEEVEEHSGEGDLEEEAEESSIQEKKVDEHSMTNPRERVSDQSSESSSGLSSRTELPVGEGNESIEEHESIGGGDGEEKDLQRHEDKAGESFYASPQIEDRSEHEQESDSNASTGRHEEEEEEEGGDQSKPEDDSSSGPSEQQGAEDNGSNSDDYVKVNHGSVKEDSKASSDVEDGSKEEEGFQSEAWSQTRDEWIEPEVREEHLQGDPDREEIDLRHGEDDQEKEEEDKEVEVDDEKAEEEEANVPEDLAQADDNSVSLKEDEKPHAEEPEDLPEVSQVFPHEVDVDEQQSHDESEAPAEESSPQALGEETKDRDFEPAGDSQEKEKVYTFERALSETPPTSTGEEETKREQHLEEKEPQLVTPSAVAPKATDHGGTQDWNAVTFSSVQRYWAGVTNSDYLLIEGKKSPSFGAREIVEYAPVRVGQGLSQPSSAAAASTSNSGAVEPGHELHHGEDAGASSNPRWEYDFEKAVREQTTHDLICPVCNSCVTKRVILRKRKRTIGFDPRRPKPQPEQELPREWAPETEVPVSRELDVTDEGYEAWGCLACFAVFYHKVKSSLGQGTRVEDEEPSDRVECLPLLCPTFRWGAREPDDTPEYPPLVQTEEPREILEPEQETRDVTCLPKLDGLWGSPYPKYDMPPSAIEELLKRKEVGQPPIDREGSGGKTPEEDVEVEEGRKKVALFNCLPIYSSYFKRTTEKPEQAEPEGLGGKTPEEDAEVEEGRNKVALFNCLPIYSSYFKRTTEKPEQAEPEKTEPEKTEDPSPADPVTFPWEPDDDVPTDLSEVPPLSEMPREIPLDYVPSEIEPEILEPGPELEQKQPTIVSGRPQSEDVTCLPKLDGWGSPYPKYDMPPSAIADLTKRKEAGPEVLQQRSIVSDRPPSKDVTCLPQLDGWGSSYPKYDMTPSAIADLTKRKEAGPEAVQQPLIFSDSAPSEDVTCLPKLDGWGSSYPKYDMSPSAIADLTKRKEAGRRDQANEQPADSEVRTREDKVLCDCLPVSSTYFQWKSKTAPSALEEPLTPGPEQPAVPAPHPPTVSVPGKGPGGEEVLHTFEFEGTVKTTTTTKDLSGAGTSNTATSEFEIEGGIGSDHHLQTTVERVPKLQTLASTGFGEWQERLQELDDEGKPLVDENESVPSPVETKQSPEGELFEGIAKAVQEREPSPSECLPFRFGPWWWPTASLPGGSGEALPPTLEPPPAGTEETPRPRMPAFLYNLLQNDSTPRVTPDIEQPLLPVVPQPTPAAGTPADILKSIVHGGLDVTLVSLGIVSSGAGGGAKTITVVALGFANLIFGIITYFSSITSMYANNNAQFVEQVGHRFLFNGAIAIFSFIFFGALAPITYGFSFQHATNRDYKFVATCVVALAVIVLLGAASAYVKAKSALKVISGLVLTGFVAAVAGYEAGNYIEQVLEKLGFPAE